jgi:hypothetical protein
VPLDPLVPLEPLLLEAPVPLEPLLPLDPLPLDPTLPLEPPPLPESLPPPEPLPPLPLLPQPAGPERTRPAVPTASHATVDFRIVMLASISPGCQPGRYAPRGPAPGGHAETMRIPCRCGRHLRERIDPWS